jgi:isopenicillin N synthase-like dioxygenase
MSALGRAVVQAALAGLGLDPHHAVVQGLFDPVPLPDGHWSQADIKCFKYSRLGSHPDDDGEPLAGEIHVDIGLLTLIPAATTPGLQAFDKALRVWACLEDTRRRNDVVVFPSDVFRVLTSGFLAGTLHRVQRSAAAPRSSIPFILRPQADARIAPLPVAGSALEAEGAVRPDCVVEYARYDPEFRVASFDWVLPSSKAFGYLPRDL